MSDMNVRLVVSMVDRATSGIRKLGTQFDRLGRQMRDFGKQSMAIGAGVTAAMSVPVRAFAQAEDAATRLKVAMMGAGGVVDDSFGRINALAMSLGNRLPGTTKDFQDMMTMLMRQGVSASTVLGGTGEAAANLAVMLQMAPQAAAEFTAKLQDATGTVEKDMLDLADTIQRTFYLGVDPGNMLAAFSALAPAMSAIKMRGLEGSQAMAPLVAMLDQASLVGGSAGNALRKVFTLSFGGTKKADAALAKSRMIFTKKGEFAGLDNMFAQLQKLKKLSTEARLETMKAIWGDDSETLQALSVMIEKGKAGYEEVARKLKAQATLRQRMDKLLGTLTNLWESATGTFTNAMASFGGLIEPELKQATKWFEDLSLKIQDFIKQNPELAKEISLIGAVAGPAAIAIGGLAFAFGALSKAVAILLSPAAGVGALVLVMAGAAAMAAGLWNPIEALWPEQWDRIVEVVGGTIYRIVEFFESVVAKLKAGWESFISMIESRTPNIQVPGAPAGGIPGINPNAVPSLGPGAKPLAPLSQAAPKATVDGIVRIEVEDGRTRVRSLQSSGGIGLEAGYTGQAMAYS